MRFQGDPFDTNSKRQIIHQWNDKKKNNTILIIRLVVQCEWNISFLGWEAILLQEIVDVISQDMRFAGKFELPQWRRKKSVALNDMKLSRNEDETSDKWMNDMILNVIYEGNLKLLQFDFPATPMYEMAMHWHCHALLTKWISTCEYIERLARCTWLCSMGAKRRNSYLSQRIR